MFSMDDVVEEDEEEGVQETTEDDGFDEGRLAALEAEVNTVTIIDLPTDNVTLASIFRC